MNKILVGLLVGAALGAIDGATAWFTPQVRPEILSIIFFSTIKGVIAGVAAGWFARRVQSVPKGIAFGFAIGLILAFLVAMNPDPKTGEHYWWQIMLPGSVLGGVIGWATQRYGRPAGGRTAAASMATVALLLFSVSAYASPAQTAFDRLKALAGTWNATMLKADGDATTVVYRVTAGGSVVEETMFAGTDHEMVNMYSIDGDQLVARHYCSSGTVPLLRFDAAKSSDDRLVFDFVSKTGKDVPAFINGVTIRLHDDGKIVESWNSTAGGPKLDLYLNSRRDSQSSR